MKNGRWIFQTLVLSVALNVALLGVFFYFLIRDNPLHFSYKAKVEQKLGAPPVSTAFIEKIPSVPFERLVELLNDQRKMAEGYRICDLALGALAAFHDFDVERGLGRGKLSKQKWEFEGACFLLFPGMKEEDFNVLQTFAQNEKWPYTMRGLYKKIQQFSLEATDPSLLSFFCHTPEFVLVETLLVRTHMPIQKRTVLNLVLEGGLDHLEAFAANQEESIDFSDEVRRDFLLGAIEKRSKTAAYLLLLTDGNFAYHHLNDQQMALLLDLLTVKTEESLQFAQAVSTSSRVAQIRERALHLIGDYMGHLPTEGELTGHFVEKPVQKELRPVFRQAPPAAPSPNTHIVQDGESLWLIAKKYQISVERLMEANQLQNGVIRAGRTLKIPQK